MKLYFSKCLNRYFIAEDDKIVQVNERAFYTNKSDIVRAFCESGVVTPKIDMIEGISRNQLFEFDDKDQLLTEFAEYLI